MKNQPKGFVSGPLATILQVSRYFGAAPLRFEKEGNGWQITPSPSYSLYGFIVNTVGNLLTAQNFINHLLVQKLDKTVWFVSSFMAALTVASIVYGAPSRMRNLITSLNHMQKIHSELKIYHRQTQWTIKWIAVFVVWGTVVTIECILLCIDYNHAFDLYILFRVVCSVYFLWLLGLGLAQFFLVTLCVHSCFKSINNRLKNLLQHNITMSSPCYKTLKNITLAYTMSCQVVRNVDRSFGMMLMILLCTIFLNVITSSYFFIITSCQTYLSYDSLYQLFWCIIHTINLIIIIEPCHLIYGEMDNTNILVSRLMLNLHPVYDPLAAEVKKFCSHIKLNDIRFKPLDVITIERGLVLMVISSVTTYLVILIGLK